jgi:hypothetical protein
MLGDDVFTVTCAPGRGAAADIRQSSPGWLSLVLSMDPGRVVIDAPTVSGGGLILARFCFELAQTATRVATDLNSGQGGVRS